LINDYREANANGDVDLIFSPYYHPILPLIYDTRSARRAREDVLLPHLILNAPQDVELQLRKGWNQHKEFFGRAPRGFWPSEQSVSTEVLGIASDLGIAWAVTDERILAKTLGMSYFSRAGRDVPEQAALLYRPYKLSLSNGKEMIIVFRDQVLSDLIGSSRRQLQRLPRSHRRRHLSPGGSDYRGCVTVEEVIPEHLEALLRLLDRAGASVKVKEARLRSAPDG